MKVIRKVLEISMIFIFLAKKTTMKNTAERKKVRLLDRKRSRC